MPHQHSTLIGTNQDTGNTEPIKSVDGAIKTVVDGFELGNVIVEAPGVNTAYDVFSGTIADSTTDQALTFSDVTTGYTVQFINRTNGTTYHAKINGTGNQNIPIDNDDSAEGKEFHDQNVTSIHLSNTSGQTITYEVIVAGI